LQTVALSNELQGSAAGRRPWRWARLDARKVRGGLSAAEVRALRAGGVKLVALDGAPADLAAWAADVRRWGFQPAVALAARAWSEVVWRRLAGAVPVTAVVLRDGPAPGDDFAGLRDHVARLRVAGLSVALPGWPLCQTGGWGGDLALASEAGSATDRRCVACALQPSCRGPASLRDPVRPLPCAISNQFDLVPDAGGEIVVERGGRRERWRVDGQGVPRSTVDAALQRGQLYLDVSQKARLDDFAEDLQLCVPAAGVWRPLEHAPFADEEAVLRADLAALRGVIVDVGAGPLRYVEELAPAMAEGSVRYVAVEPERAALDRLRQKLPGVVACQGTGEALPLRDKSADAVLFLRSWNHLRDVAAALREAARVCKPGGVLIAVDNVAFGLLRTPDQLARARAVPLHATPYEHYRNDCAADAVAALERCVPDAFAVESHDDVAPGRSNQWRVRARRRTAGGQVELSAPLP
jgi:SAM-dependent methyltransferase